MYVNVCGRLRECDTELISTDMHVNEHGRLSNFTLINIQIKVILKEQHFYHCSTFDSYTCNY
jgi:hypothetical protein